MSKLVLLTLHGMGVTKENYADELQQGLRKRLGGRWTAVSVQPVWYAPVFQANEDIVWNSLAGDPRNELDSTALRKLFLFGFADAAAFERSAHAEPATYLKVQQLIHDALARGYRDCGEEPSTPVVVVAQSLGGQVISSYLWDAQRQKQIFEDLPASGTGLDAFVRLKSMRHLVTTGCNIPIFTAGLARRVNFDRPAGVVWENFYDPDDVLGWPLRQLDKQGNTYDWILDRPISAGNILTGWNPASHLGYWSDKDVLNPLAESIAGLLG